MTTVIEDVELSAPLTMSSTVDEIWEHLDHYHRRLPLRKTRKDALLAWHQSTHDAVEGSKNPPERMFTRPHRHIENVLLTAGQRDPVGTVVSKATGALPVAGSLSDLSAANRRALERVVKSDYDTLLEQVDQMSIVFRGQRRAEVEKEWQSKVEGLTRATVKLSAARTRAQELIDKTLDDLGKQGYKARSGYRSTVNVPELVVDGRQAAFAAVEHEVTEAARRAKSIITVKRNEAMRAILLATVTPEAAEAAVLSVPNIDNIMATAQEQAAAMVHSESNPPN